MSEKEYFIDDRVIIPKEIFKMTKEERHAEIARLETLAAAEKKRILEQQKKETA